MTSIVLSDRTSVSARLKTEDPAHRPDMPRRKLVLASALSLLASTAHAATVGNEGFTVPPFKCFGEVAKSRYELDKAESDLSGASYDPESGNIFVVNNGDRKVYEISGSAYEYNTLENTFDVTDLTLDLEGISALGGRYFAITDENPAKIIKVKLNADGTVSDDSELSSGLSSGTPAAGSNLGFEGVTKIVGLVLNGLVVLFSFITFIIAILGMVDANEACPEGQDCVPTSMVFLIILGFCLLVLGGLAAGGIHLNNNLFLRIATLVMIFASKIYFLIFMC